MTRAVVSELRAIRRLTWGAVLRRGVYPLQTRHEIVDTFHCLYHDSHLFDGTWSDTRWLGVPVAKTPLDLWVYQEILVELRPALVIETGTLNGGSALFLATVLDVLGAGRVLTIDVETRSGRPAHSRIEYATGSSTDPAVHRDATIAAREAGGAVLVVLDSDHTRDHVLAELRLYAPLVSAGSYVIVEDTNVNGHTVSPEHGPGPAEAVEAFLREDSRFEIDRSREKHYLTFNPGGYLRRQV
jgi:cephalosporin hydroxylase